MTALPKQPIPIIVVTGFLGAGKTTLINRVPKPDACPHPPLTLCT